MFFRFYALVCSRCFGWGLPSTTLIPMADNLNHNSVTVVSEVIHREYQKIYDEKNDGEKYFSKSRYTNDYSAIYSDEELDQHFVNLLGRFDKAKFDNNAFKFSLANWE